MAKILSLSAHPRADLGRKAVKTVRRAGNVPAILYGKKTAPTPLAIDAKELRALLHKVAGENVLVELSVKDETKGSRLALLQDVQMHPLEDYIVHVDLHELAKDEVMHTEVAIHPEGEAIGVRSNGGILEIALRHVHVECLPADLPEYIAVDINALEVGQSIHVADLKLPKGVKVLNPKELTVISVAAPVKEEEKPAGVEEVKQPEVIKEKKVEEPAAADAKGGKDAKAAAKPAAKK